MKILILGGNRFAGAEVVSQAVLAGHDVTVLALDPPTLRARTHVRFLKADRTDREGLIAVLKGMEFDAVLDNIAFAPHTVRLLLEVLQGRVGRYVLTSSVDIYLRDTPLASSEDMAVFEPSDQDKGPASERYLRGKRGSEKELMKADVPWAVIRPAIVFGRTDPIPPAPRNLHPLNSTYGRSLFMPARVVDGGPILLRDDDRRAFSLAGAQDVARAILLVAEHPMAVGKGFNVAGDEIWTSERLVRATSEAAGTETQIVRVTQQDLDLAGLSDYYSPYGKVKTWSVVDNTQLKTLGWEPTPAKIQLAKLVEELPAPEKRPFYDTRLREIALAYRLLRQRADAVVTRAAVDQPEKTSSPHARTKLVPGRFSREAAEKWQASVLKANKGPQSLHADHFRLFNGCPVSSIGIGTHRGDLSDEADKQYYEALMKAVRAGMNVIDTGINYRMMKAERLIGLVVAELKEQGGDREALCICTKGGFIPEDPADGRPFDRYIRDTYLAEDLIGMREAVLRHTMKPAYIRKSFAQSFANLGLEHIDIYYLHNPERAKVVMEESDFYAALRENFNFLEEQVAAGKIGQYGIATWQGLLVDGSTAEYLSLEKIVNLAREAGGENHHLRTIQVPFNISDLSALKKKNQAVSGTTMSVFEAAAGLGLYVFSSASVVRGQTGGKKGPESRLAEACPDLNPIQAALQFARSAPGVGTALIGLRLPEYVDQALAVASHPVMDSATFSNVTG